MVFMLPAPKTAGKTPRIVVTGFTTALLGDERTLREFIVGDLVVKGMEDKGENALLYLICDSYDPLHYRQLRVAVNKDEKLLKQFEGYCGRAISEIPDPFECHENYSQHFEKALLQRLRSLDIYPVILDSYRAYQSGHYSDYVLTTLENYSKIREMLAQTFGLHMANDLFRPQCPKCLCLDATHIHQVTEGVVHFNCERCEESSTQSIHEIKGKLSWKLDCAARWNIYGIDVEIFSKAHVSKLGSFEVASFMSQNFYGGVIPKPVRYGAVQFSRDLSFKLLEILPPKILKALFTTHMTRDLDINRGFVENFCQNFPLRSGLSYVEYIRKELPFDALRGEGLFGSHAEPNMSIEAKSLVVYGNRFSKFYYDKEYQVRFPDAKAIDSSDRETALMAHSMIQYSLSVRRGHYTQWSEVRDLIRSYLHSQKIPPQLYRYLRQLFGVADGPNVATLLAILPKEYLCTTGVILNYFIASQLAGKDMGDGKDMAPEPASATLSGVLDEVQAKPESSVSSIVEEDHTADER